jgi:Flp pilus assembly pilin Flp
MQPWFGEGVHVKIDIFAIKRTLAELIQADRGQAAMEYVLICALLACGVTAGYTGVAQAVGDVFNSISITFAHALNTSSN